MINIYYLPYRKEKNYYKEIENIFNILRDRCRDYNFNIKIFWNKKSRFIMKLEIGKKS